MRVMVSLAVCLLLGGSSALNIKLHTGTGDKAVSESFNAAEVMSQANRFINSKGEAIILAQTTGHARIELRAEPRNATLSDIKKKNDDSHKKCDPEVFKLVTNHCPKNDGKLAIQQDNLEDFAYVSDIYVGNPPQKLRALYDTGSTNTWVLNQKTPLPGNAPKMYAYDDTSSCTH